MPRAEARDLKSGVVIHHIDRATKRMARWKREIGEMSEVELVLAAALIKVRSAELRKRDE
ncbi:MAG: hypothetical protein ACJATT_005628 [Myxococcota bacterium]|jgi:hypothetical protein